MGFWSRVKAAVVRSFRTSDSTYPSEFMGNPSYAGEEVSHSSALALSAVWACVNLIAGTTSTLPCLVYRKNPDGQKELADDHSLYRVLHDSPNFDQTAVDFWEWMSISLELYGNAYARIARNAAGQVNSLYPIAPQSMSVKRTIDGGIEYEWSEEGKPFQRRERDVFHVRGFGGNPLGGLSTLSLARNTLGLSLAQERAAGETFKNGMRPSGILRFQDFLTKEQRELTETRLVEKFAGAMNAGRPLVLEGGTDWQQLTINPEDAQMLESRAFSVEEIARFFGVPPFMIGHTEKSTSWGTGIEQQTIGFQKYTLRRRLKRIEQAVVKQLMTPADRAAGMSVKFNLDGLLRADTASRANFYNTMTLIGAMTINEVRELENLPPIAGGDVARMQMQNIPITEAENGNTA